jgi:hypothetical protein
MSVEIEVADHVQHTCDGVLSARERWRVMSIGLLDVQLGLCLLDWEFHCGVRAQLNHVVF